MTNYTNLQNLAKLSTNDRNWYAKARKNIKDFAKQNNVNFKILAGVVAITSQNIRLSHNQDIVKQWIKDGADKKAAEKIKHFGIVKRNVARFLETGEVTGPKIKAFYEALIGDTSSIVLDTHMAKVFIPNKSKWSKKDMSLASDKINKVAKSLGWKPYQVQAAIWCTIYKQINGITVAANYSF